MSINSRDSVANHLAVDTCLHCVPIFVHLSLGDQLLISVLFVCGDSYLMLAKCQGNLAVHQEDYRFKSEEDVFISEAAEECISGQGGHSSSVKFVSDVEKNLLKR